MSDALRTFQFRDITRPLSRQQTHAARPIRVLHLFKRFRPDFTGDGLYFEKLIPLLEREGVHNEVAAEVTKAGADATPSARLFGAYRTAGFNPLLLLWLMFNAWRFDVVHVHSAIDRFFAYHLIARLFGCRVVQSCTLDDGLNNLIDDYRPRFRGIVRRLCGLIHDVVAISPRLYDNSIGVAPAAGLHLIPQGVKVPDQDPALRAAARHSFGFTPNDVVLLFVGGVCPRKDVRFLIDHHPAELGRLHLLVVGPNLDAAYAEKLKDAIAHSPANGRIHMVGYMEDPTAAYQAADIFALASHMEGCPNVLLEAMANGLPVVARRLPDTTDSIVDHGRSGFLFASADEYRTAIQALVTQPGRRATLGEAARTTVSAAYDMRAVAKRYAQVYAKAA